MSVPRMEETMIQIQSLFALSGVPFLSGNFPILLGIALSACLLGIQVACIIVLAKKLRFARRESERMEGRDSHNSYSEYGIAAIGASFLPLSIEGILSIAVALNALAALVLVILVGSVRSSGYDYATLKDLTAKKKKPERRVPRYVEIEEDAPVSYEPLPKTASDFSEQEDAEENLEELEEDASESQELAVAAFADNAVGAPAGTTTTVTTVEEFRDGQNPVRVVKIEKEYTETIRETIPGSGAAEADDQTERLIEKIDRLIEKLEESGETHRTHIENGIILGTDEPVPSDEDDDEDDFGEDALTSDENEEDESSDEVDDREYFTGNERIIGFDEDTGYYIVAHYRKSFEAKLIQARPNIKQYYSELKNALLSYKGSKSRISWTADSFHNGRTQIAKINVKSRILELYLALDPASLEGTVYRGQDVSHLKKYADTPFRYKLRTPRKFKWAMELVARVCEEQGLSPIDIDRVDYEAMYPFEDTDSLVSRGLIKEYIREEKPASTFELDESHVPAVSDMDDSVIPANANFSWEFDNEVMAQKEPEPVETEEEPAQATEESAPATPTVLRETTRTTQVRYTEQYFGESGEPTTTYKEYLSEDGPFKVDFFESEDKKEEPVEENVTEESNEEAIEEVVEESCEDTYEEAYEDSYEENVEEDTVWESEEDVLDWSIPAGVSEQEAVVIDPEASYDDVYAAEETYDETYASEEEYTYDEEIEYTDDGQVYEDQAEEQVEEPVEEPVSQMPKLNPEIALVDVSLLDAQFEEGDVIDLQALKNKGLVLDSAKILKIYKSNPYDDLTKSFTVVADHLTVDAIFAIHRANGSIQKINKMN